MLREGFHWDISSQPSLSSRMSDIGILFCARTPSFSSSATTTESFPRLLIFTITNHQARHCGLVYYKFVSAHDPAIFHCVGTNYDWKAQVKQYLTGFQGCPLLGLQYY